MGLEMTLALTSSAFKNEAEIPSEYTCEGENSSPPLAWSDVPEQAQSLVLIVDDPDAPDPQAPRMTWVHWVVYNIPPAISDFPAGVAVKSLSEKIEEGLNDWKQTGYGGPCPPVGRHRYFHKIYALDCTLKEIHKPTKANVLDAMDGHVISEAMLCGLYEKLQ
jgi:Raf kinase inhibitor-like YbhB/YbcL family protein